MESDGRVEQARLWAKSGKLNEAILLYNKLIGENLREAQLYFERGRASQLAGAFAEAERDYRICLLLEPGHLRAREYLGQVVRRASPFVGASSDRISELPADDSFVYVVGSSYVRAFSSTTLFIPLWLGPANELSFINDQRAQKTRLHLLATIGRCDLRKPVLLVMGNNDPIMHADNLAGTKDAQARGELGSDREILEGAALRYIATIEDILLQYPAIKLFVLGGCLMFSAEHNKYIRLSNLVLEAECRRLNIPFIDFNGELADPGTGNLRVDCASHPEDTHLSKKASLDLISSALRRLGCLPHDTLPFEWSFLWRAPLSEEFSVSIWGEPHTGSGNLVHSQTVAFSHVVERALHVLLGTVALHGEPTAKVLVPYCREGFVPLSFPIGSVASVTGLDEDAASIATARRLAHFFRRPDVSFEPVDRGASFASAVQSYDYVFAALRDDVSCDPRTVLDELLSVCRHTVMLLSTYDWSKDTETPPSGRMVMSLADAATRSPWKSGTLLLQRAC